MIKKNNERLKRIANYWTKSKKMRKRFLVYKIAVCRFKRCAYAFCTMVIDTKIHIMCVYTHS